MENDSVTVTVKFTVKSNRLSEFFKELSKIEYDLFDMYWIEGVSWPVKVETIPIATDPIRNVTGY